MSRSPNILYLHSHDSGRFIQPYGFPVQTPHLQRFAEESVLFRQAFSVAPTCSPSRAALLTGRYPHNCGVHGLTNAPWSYRLDDPSTLLMHHLSSHGYETVLGGVQHIAERTLEAQREMGFEVFLNEDDLGEDVPDLHERAAAYLREAPDRPWFLSVGFDETHRNNRQGDAESGQRFSKHTHYEPTQLDSRYCRPPAIYPDLPELRQDMASFSEGLQILDTRIGHVLDALRESGEAENTIVLVTTDHGPPWPGMKGNLNDMGTGVTLMLRYPGRLEAGTVQDAMVNHLDVFPTLCELAKLPPPDWLEGTSLVPLMEGDSAVVHSTLFSEQGWHEVADPQRSVRTERYRYVRRLETQGPKLRNTDEGPAKNVLAPMDWFERDLGPELLFDLFLDPMERHNLADRPEARGVLREMRGLLEEWCNRTEDTLFEAGPVWPPGYTPSVSKS